MRSLPLSKSLTKFPQSWTYTVIPLLFRIGTGLLIVMSKAIFNSGRNGKTTSLPHPSTISTSVRRLFFYFMVMQFRGWVLYVFMNEILMKKLLLSFIPLSAMGTITNKQQEGQGECWYSNLVHQQKANYEGDECYGQEFDFSDHIVLFFAHYFPIMIFEAIFCVLYPFWTMHHHDKTTVEHFRQSRSQQTVIFLFNTIIHMALVVTFGYLSFITLASVYSTGNVNIIVFSFNQLLCIIFK